MLRSLMNLWNVLFRNNVQCALVGFYLGRSVDGFHGMWQSRSSDLLRAVPELKSILESQPNFRSMHLLHPILRNRTREPFSAMVKCFNLELDYFLNKLKVRWFRNGFWGLRFPPKNERKNSFLLLFDLFSFVFWRKSTTSKNLFEINWPLPLLVNILCEQPLVLKC